MDTNEHKLRTLIAKGEGLDIEFKSYHDQVPKSVYETVCAFLNRNGGTLLLGVGDDGSVSGIASVAVMGGADPQLIEGDNFRMIISIPEFGENPAKTPKVIGHTDAHEAEPATQQATQQVTQQVAKLLAACVGELSRAELMQAVGIRDRVSFSRNYLDPALGR